MKTLTLTRHITANGAVLGELTGLSRPIYTLEEEWNGNKQNESCIPTGTYEVLPHAWDADTQFKFRRTWQLQNVPGRSGILIHAGNTRTDTHGCILVGLGMAIGGNMASVAQSQAAMDVLREEVGQEGFILTIK